MPGSFLPRIFKTGLIGKITQPNQSYCDRQALIIGTGPEATRTADAILDFSKNTIGLRGFIDSNRKGLWRYRDIPLIGGFSELEKIITASQIDFIAMAVEPEELIAAGPAFATAEKMGVPVYLFTQIYKPALSRPILAKVAGIPVLGYASTPSQSLPIQLKGILDRIGALAGIIISAPLLVFISLLIKWDSRGPILFKQTRTGINGRSFKLWKFRTMTIDAEEKKEELKSLNEMSGPVFKIAQDPRVTKIGRFLRKYSIDELPQLFNILFGDMSLVGPRPPLPSEVARFEPWQHRKLSVKPGLTCLWQTSGRNNIDFEEWMKLDLKYIDNWSLWEDAKIIVRTIPTVLKGTGM